jgi:putative acetyltransferase
LIVRVATEADLDDVLFVEREAFGEDEEAELVRDLLGDPSAKPLLSLLAYADDAPVGHVLFTSVRLADTDDTPSCSILAPLAVVPDAQKQGVGGALVRKGLALLAESGVGLVFVLGHPEYYPRHGFQPAGVLGLTAPYPIPEKDAGAWMVQELRPGVLGTVRGTVVVADKLMKPEYWRE